jgi:hypothetical protein
MLKFFLPVLGALLCGGALADSNCNAILQHGHYNITITQGKQQATSFYYAKYCSKIEEHYDSSTGADIDVNVIGYGGGSGGYSDSERKSKLEEWCSKVKAGGSSSAETSTEIRTINDASVRAWESCMSQQEVKYVYDFNSEHQTTVQVSVSYAGSATNGVLAYGGVEERGYHCRVVRYDAETEETAPAKAYSTVIGDTTTATIGRGGITATCTRNAPEKVVQDGVTFDHYGPGSIAILIAGHSSLLNFYSENVPVQASVKDQFVPKNAVMAFADEKCPSDWRPYVEGIGRVIIGEGVNPGLQPIGHNEAGGAPSVVLTASNIPAHVHYLPDIGSAGHMLQFGKSNMYAGLSFSDNPGSDRIGMYVNMALLQGTGLGDIIPTTTQKPLTDPPAAVSIMMPYKGLLYCIKN